eukprot:6815305-Alexandrium_andersonii.AAC.1
MSPAAARRRTPPGHPHLQTPGGPSTLSGGARPPPPLLEARHGSGTAGRPSRFPQRRSATRPLVRSSAHSTRGS